MSSPGVVYISSQQPLPQPVQSGENTSGQPSFADVISKSCTTLAFTILCLAVVLSIVAACGIISEITGNAILKSSGQLGYAEQSKAVEMGWRGGILGFLVTLPFCGGMFSFEATRKNPILILPFLVVGGVITGALGFQSIERVSLPQDLGGLTSTHAIRAGALGSAVVGGGVLLPFTLVRKLRLKRGDSQNPTPDIPLITSIP